MIYLQSTVLLIIIITFLVGFDCLKCDNNDPRNTLEKLRRKLLCDYDPAIHPGNRSNATKIQMSLVLSKYNYEEKRSTIVVSSIRKMSWYDDSFKWDPKDYDNITRYDESFYNIWSPELILFESHLQLPGSCWSNKCFIRSDSKVSCFFLCNNRAHCVSDYKNWPQNVQLCYLSYGSWNSHENQIHFDVDKVKINTKKMLKNHQWELLSATTLIEDGYYDGIDSLQSITYKLLIGQYTNWPIALILVPFLVLTIINLILLWMTPGCKQRTILSMFLLLSHFNLMRNFHFIVPHNGETLPVAFDCMKRSIFITLVLLIETIVVKLIIESTEKPALWMESITVSARSNRIGAFIFPLHRLQKQDSVELIEKDTDRKSNDHFIRITYTKIIDGTLFLILILMYAEMIYKIFLTDIPEPYEYLDVDE